MYLCYVYITRRRRRRRPISSSPSVDDQSPAVFSEFTVCVIQFRELFTFPTNFFDSYFETIIINKPNPRVGKYFGGEKNPKKFQNCVGIS